jgi:hypothetical protein
MTGFVECDYHLNRPLAAMGREMSSTSTTVTEGTNIIVVRTTVIHQEYFHYSWLLLALAGAAFVAWGLRLLFWCKDSN